MTAKYVVIASDQGPTRVAGTFNVHEKEMTLFLNLLPGVRFFVAHDDQYQDRFRIFSGRSTRPNPRPFFNQVGSGKKIEQLNVLELFFPDLNQKYYVYLQPNETALSSNLGG